MGSISLVPFKLLACREGFGAGDEIRTHDPNHGKVVLYQLSYARVRTGCRITGLKAVSKGKSELQVKL